MKALTSVGGAPAFVDTEMMPGVEDLQVQFGIDTGDYDNDGAIDPGVDVNNDGIPESDGRATRYVNPDFADLDRAAGRVRAALAARARREPEPGFDDGRTLPLRRRRVHAERRRAALPSHAAVPDHHAAQLEDPVMRADRRPPAPPPLLRQRGAALVIALLMLMILTILALSGINTATTELAMAGNEQYLRNAAQAATAGIEEAITDIGAVPTSPGAAPTPRCRPCPRHSTSTAMPRTTRFIGDETGLPQSSADKFVGLHFQIDSTGTSLRNASDLQQQGVMVVAASGSVAVAAFGQLGGGLE